MSRWNFVTDKDLSHKCTVCVAMQKGWFFSVAQERLDRLDKDGRDVVVDIEMEFTSILPFNDAEFSFQGSDVCLTHLAVIPYKKQKSASLLSIGDMPPGFKIDR